MASGAGAVRAGRAYVEIFADTAALRKGLARTRKDLARFALSIKAVGAGIKDQFLRAQQAISGLGSSLTVVGAAFTALGVAASAGIGKAVAEFSRFDKQMLFVQGILRQTAQDMEMLRERAAELGRTTSFTAVEVADGMTELARAGRTTEQIYIEVAGALDLARGTMTDLATTTKILVSVMNQFQMGAEESARVADTLAAASNLAVHNMEELGLAFKFVGPIALTLGMTLEETAGVLNILANNGLRATLAGRQFARVLKELNQPSKRKILEDMGITLETEEGFVTIIQLFEQLNDATKNLSKGEKFGFFNEMFGIGAVAAQILSDNVAGFDDMTDKIIGGRGAAEDLRKTIESGLFGSFKKITSAATGVALIFAEKLVPAIQMMSKQIIQFFRLVAESIKSSQYLAIQVTAAVGAFTAFGASVLAAGLSLRVLGAAMSGFIGLITVALIPLQVAISAITVGLSIGLKAAALVASTAMLTLRTAVVLVANGLKVLSGLLSLLPGVISAFVGGVNLAIAAILALATAVTTVIAVLPGLAAFLVLMTSATVAIGVLEKVAGAVKGVANAVSDGYSSMETSVRNWSRETVAKTRVVGGAFAMLATEIKTSFMSIDLKQGLEEFAKDFQRVFNGLTNAVKAGDLKGVFEITLAYMKVSWARFIQYLQTSGIVKAFDEISSQVIAFGQKMQIVFEELAIKVQNFAGRLQHIANKAKAFRDMIQSAFDIREGAEERNAAARRRFDEPFAPIAGRSAQDMQTAFDAIQRAQLKYIDDLAKARILSEKDANKAIIRARWELSNAIHDSIMRTADAENKARKEQDQARRQQIRDEQRLQEERKGQVLKAMEGVTGGGGGESRGTFGSRLAKQILVASQSQEIADKLDEGNEIARNTNRILKGSGFIAGMA